ncbi:MAG TPA: peptidoglycan bridge formation glycyltransferase FemA/FemB family protein [Bdellovibrio sp.]|uniref:lipid II:glycine glycyltransferase FemX n=1 Tax=Bdellovibrio sp. TaxID=28201 RepID=UPI002F211BCD
MLNWKVFDQDATVWNHYLTALSYFSIYQTYEWGEVKKNDGWYVVRLIGFDRDQETYSMAQIFVKKLPFGGVFFWCPGGVMGKDLGLNMKSLKKILKFRFYYFRCSFHDPDISLSVLEKLGWRKPTYSMNSNLAMALSLEASEEDLLMQMSSNWRHNLKRFEKKEVMVEPWIDPDASTLFAYYQKFESLKKLSQQHSQASIEETIKKFGRNLIIYRAFNKDGELLALRGYILAGTRALDWYAISTESGRSCYASYGVLWRIIRDAKTRGILFYDLSGVDPVGNAGVYNFKKGAGAYEVRYPGEFEKASFFLLKIVVNFLLKKRLSIS